MTHNSDNGNSDDGRVPPPDEGGEGDAHYQPWLRNQSDPAPGGVTRPQPLPTRDAAAARGASTRDAAGRGAPRAPNAQETADDLARPIAMPGAAPADDGPGLGDKMREAMDKAGDAIERAELGRRAREASEKGGALARRGAEVAGRALRSAAKATGEAAQGAAERAGPALKAAAEKIGEGTARAGEAIGEGGRKAGEAARRALDAAPVGDRRGDPVPPPSQLDKLLAEDAQGVHPAVPPTAPPPPPLSSSVGTAPQTPISPQSASQPVEDPSTLPLFSGAAPQPTPKDTDYSMSQDPSAAMPQAAAAPSYTASNAAPARPAASGGGGAGQSGGRLGGGDWMRHPGTWMLGGLALVLAGFVGGTIWSDGVNDRATVERIIDDHLLNHPEILPRAMERLQANHMAQKVAEHRAALTRPFSGAWAGAADGDVTLVVFTDYACGFCRASEPDIERLIREDRKLKVVFRELPIISPESEPAARLALVAARAGRFMDVHSALFAAGNPTQQTRNTVAERFNLGADEASMNNAGITAELRSNITLAQQMGIDGTPTWIIGDKVLTGAVGYDALRDAIRAAREKK